MNNDWTEKQKQQRQRVEVAATQRNQRPPPVIGPIERPLSGILLIRHVVPTQTNIRSHRRHQGRLP